MTEFGVGDKAVYPVHGIAEVTALEQRSIDGRSRPVYILRILQSGLRIMVPTDNADAVGLRAIISDGQVEEVFALLRAKIPSRDAQTWNRRYREYMDRLKTGDPFEIAVVLRELCMLRNSKKSLSFGERRMLETARGLLVKEIALARRTSEDCVEKQIDAIFTAAA